MSDLRISGRPAAHEPRRLAPRVAPPHPGRDRLESIDILRGLALVAMALDHVRDFLYDPVDPTDLDATSGALFLTRWVTHFCAPVFIFLAGTGAFLSASRGKSRPELARFLLSRGVWMIVLELTALRLVTTFSLDYREVLLTVLWAIGWSMIGLAGLIWLPTWAIAAFGVLMIAGHNLLDAWEPTRPGLSATLMRLLHGPPSTLVERDGGMVVRVLYPLVPWVGVMAAGYAFGALMLRPRPWRRRVLVGLGLALTAAFVGLRALNLYGDPNPWTPRPTAVGTVMAFLNCAKYPPSLAFLLMTLGPAFVLLALLDRAGGPGPLGRALETYGRVPLFFFLVHWATAHALAVAMYAGAGRPVGWLFAVPAFDIPDGSGFSLPVVYLAWAAVVVGLYPACRWFADLKRRRRDLAWLSYF